MMALFAQRAFDLLASQGSAKLSDQKGNKAPSWGHLHAIMGLEPHEAPQSLSMRSNWLEGLTQLPYLEYLHPSKVLPHLSRCAKDTQAYLIHWLPQRLQEEAISFTGEKPLPLPSNPVACEFIMRSWKGFFDALETSPLVFAPTSQLEKLLKLEEKELYKRAIGMAIFALEPRLKHFIDREARDKVKQALHHKGLFPAVDFIRFLKTNRKELNLELPYQFPLHLWDGEIESFVNLCEKFGFACLARLIEEETDDFKYELSLHVSDHFASMLTCHASVTPEVRTALLKSLELTDLFLKETSLK